MMDVVFVGVGVGFFALCWGFATLTDRVKA
jgi:hypothetical protein